MPQGFQQRSPLLAAALDGSQATRRDRLALGSLLNQGQGFGLKLPAAPASPPVRRRTRIWELDSSFHCSIIGTCLATAELRQILEKMDITGARSMSEHDLHRQGVSVAGWRDGRAKLLNKSIDRRHARTIAQFDRAKSEAAVIELWEAAVARGEIPGAYWAVLTHTETSTALLKRAFGEVHMLSHLVGAANRADIRRLSDIENENAALREKVERQQNQIRDTIIARDARINSLTAELARVIAAGVDGNTAAPDSDGLAALVAALEQRLAAAQAHGERLAVRLAQAEDRWRAEAQVRAANATENATLRDEIAALEASLAPAVSPASAPPDLNGAALLYVGGRTGHVAGLRSIAERFSASLLHHDGGLETSTTQLAGLIARAEMVFFPVDCVSHDAMHLVKRLCRQAGRPYLPLRSASLTTFLAALRNLPAAVPVPPEAAAF